MYFKALAWLLLTTSHILAAEGVCMFPPDYLPPDISSITQSADFQQDGDTAYVYTDQFGSCSGCVTELSLCYFTSSQPNPITVFIVNEDNTIVHVHSFNGPVVSTENHDTYCEDFGSFLLCCSYETPTQSEQFEVQSTNHYGVWSEGSLPVHMTEVEEGFVTQATTNLEVGVNIGSSTSNIQKIYFHFIITPGSCETNTSATISFDTTSTPTILTAPSSSLLIHPLISTTTTALYGSNTAFQYTTTNLPQYQPSQTVSPDSTEATVVSLSYTVLQSVSKTLLVSNDRKKDTSNGAMVGPLVVGGATAGAAALTVVTALLATLGIALVVRSRAARHSQWKEKSAILTDSVNGHSLTPLGEGGSPKTAIINSHPAHDSSNQQECESSLSEPIKTDSNPAYASTSIETDPAYATSSSHQEDSVKTRPIEISSNLAYGSSLQSNPAYSSSGQVTKIDSNPAYGSSGQAINTESNPAYSSPTIHGQKEDIYSYIPNEEEHMQLWSSSVAIPTSLNEAYTSMIEHREKLEPGSGGDSEGYVVNSLVYEVVPEELKTRGDPQVESEYEVDQLIYNRRETEDSKQGSIAESLTINEAYIAVNQAAK